MQRKVVALRAVKEASVFLKKEFRRGHTGAEKADGTMVSAADHGSEKKILSILKRAFPDDAILSEESGKTSGTSGYRWILDPLDGTHNFLAGIPIFGILLALEKNGIVIFSVCLFPMFDECFVAEKGKGAFLNGRRIRVSKTKSLEGSVFLGDGNRTLQFRDTMKDIKAFQEEGCRFRFLGEGPFGMTRVALGTALVAVLRLGKIWDIAAPALLIEEAGGKVTDMDGKSLGKKESALVATNGILHAKALSILGNL